MEEIKKEKRKNDVRTNRKKENGWQIRNFELGRRNKDREPN